MDVPTVNAHTSNPELFAKIHPVLIVMNARIMEGAQLSSKTQIIWVAQEAKIPNTFDISLKKLSYVPVFMPLHMEGKKHYTLIETWTIEFVMFSPNGRVLFTYGGDSTTQENMIELIVRGLVQSK